MVFNRFVKRFTLFPLTVTRCVWSKEETKREEPKVLGKNINKDVQRSQFFFTFLKS